MKINVTHIAIAALFSVCLFCASSAHAQLAPVLQNTPAPIHMIEHTEHAAPHAMAQENNLLGSSYYSWAKGEVPLAELASPIYETPLGDVARAYRKQHALEPKAVMTLEK
jgi:hypothetical protein